MEGEFDQRPLRAASPFPDVMAFSSSTSVKGKAIEDPDTCRICRGEGSPEEPLFYPCKCSGSIKFVHQNCLMEWLGHSQKKYCELCKTPFRFTKLYDPDMPSELPAPVFVKELTVLGLRTLLTWLRFVLVAFVWLGWLPWSMRAIWRALFWLADGRWPTSHASNANQTNMQTIINGTTLITQSLAAGNSAASTSTPPATSEPPNVLSPMTSLLNFSTGEPVVFAIAKRLFLGLFAVSTSVPDESSPQINATLSKSPRGPSWLSNVTFLNSLTSSPTVNNIVIDTLEGQLITLFVVISFILVFLIREWVVQQQPVVNVGEEERDAVAQLIDRNQGGGQAQEDAADAHDRQPEIAEDERPGDDYDESGSDTGEHLPSDDDWPFEGRAPSPEFTAVDSRPILPMRSSSSRPTLPSRNALDDASNIQRTIEETATSSANQSWPGIDTFKELWSRGEGNPDRILQIIQEEGREEELGWIVNAMTKLQGSNIGQSSVTPSPSAGGHLREIFDDDVSVNISQPGGGPSATQVPGSFSEPSIAACAEPGKLDVPSEHRSDEVGQGNSEPTVENTESPVNPIAHPEPSSSTANEEGTASPATNATESAQANDQTLVDRVLDWFWGDLTPEPDIRAEDGDVHVIDDPPLEAVLAPVPNRGNDAAGNADAADPWQEQVAGPANQDANDADVVEEADDFEGILELIGMQGPIFGLLQNGVFSALLISFTIAVGIWLPYLWGKIALVFLTSPIQLFVSVPLTMLSITADVAIDTLIGSVGYVFYWVIVVFKTILRAVYGLVPLLDLIPPGTLFTKTSLTLIHESSQRLNKIMTGFFDFHETDLPMFSVLAHQALRIHEARIAGLFRMIGAAITFVLYDLPTKLISPESRHDLVVDISQLSIADLTGYLKTGSESFIQQGLSLLGKSGWVSEDVALDIGSDYELARWDTTDRTIAILIGYTFASLLGILYLKINSMFTGVNRGQRIDGVVAEILNQAGGVMKVILIIGIEMIVFPLYCGLLLDLALLPLFEDATLASRIDFTVSSPLTSLFIHWFVGTCYMFHFALFVSMCRKIMRTGVLYFIRDPDDPTFHPVRDVLERNIVTQLRKIAFSALVYGGLVVVCLGGVVWGLSYSFDNVLPIHWSSKVPVLEFPVDLLFYNSIMPLAVRALKPSEVLNGMYNWWFHVCARHLRLSNFLLGERHRDEEGHHVGCTWREFLAGKKGNTEAPVVTEEGRRAAEEKGERVYFLRDGRFVRAPASDQVRIPKKAKVFLEVTEDNERIDGVSDDADALHGKNNDMFTKVYVPPNFRLRISFFIFTIWMYAAATGVGATIVPLVVGRKLLSLYFPSFIQINDIYAFSVGLYLLGGIAYILLYSRSVYTTVTERFLPRISAMEVMTQAAKAIVSATRLVYVATAFTVLIPSFLALLVELYVLIPIHSYTQAPHPHVIHFIQDWTLGVLYVQMGVRFIQWTPASRLSTALSAITRDGWLRPNAGVATRSIILPASILSTFAVVLPFCLGFVANATAFSSAAPEIQSKVYRYAYPASLTVCLLVYSTHLFCKQLDVWRASIRDDVYLIGERLHNLGEKKARDVAGAHRRVDTS